MYTQGIIDVEYDLLISFCSHNEATKRSGEAAGFWNTIASCTGRYVILSSGPRNARANAQAVKFDTMIVKLLATTSFQESRRPAGVKVAPVLETTSASRNRRVHRWLAQRRASSVKRAGRGFEGARSSAKKKYATRDDIAESQVFSDLKHERNGPCNSSRRSRGSYSKLYLEPTRYTLIEHY